MRLHGIVNSDESHIDPQPHPDDGNAVVNHHRAIATGRDDGQAGSASYKRASVIYKPAATATTATATAAAATTATRRLSPPQQ